MLVLPEGVHWCVYDCVHILAMNPFTGLVTDNKDRKCIDQSSLPGCGERMMPLPLHQQLSWHIWAHTGLMQTARSPFFFAFGHCVVTLQHIFTHSQRNWLMSALISGMCSVKGEQILTGHLSGLMCRSRRTPVPSCRSSFWMVTCTLTTVVPNWGNNCN